MRGRALIADHDAQSRAALQASMMRSGFVVAAVADGASAVELLAAGAFALVFYREDLPDFGGALLCQRVRRLHRQTRVVLLGAERSEHERRDLLAESGLDALLHLPLHDEDLERLLAAWGMLAEPGKVGRLDYAVPAALAPVLPAAGARDSELPAMPHPSADPLASQGALQDMPLPRLVYDLYTRNFTGALHLARRGLRRAIFFRAGRPVRVESHQLAENLGQLLLERLRISEEQYLAAQDLQSAQGLKQGEALVRVGALSEAELQAALAEQTALKLAQSFAWRDGTYAIAPLEALPVDMVTAEIDPRRAISAGVRDHYDLDSLVAFFTPLREHLITVTPHFAVHHPILDDAIETLGLQNFLDGHTSFGQVLARADGDLLGTAQALYVLLVLDMLVPTAPPPPVARPGGRRPTTGTRDAAALAAALDRELERLRASTCFTALEVSEDATVPAVRAAYDARRQALQLDALPPTLSPEARRRARLVSDMLTRAQRLLSTPDARDFYRSVLHLPRAAEPQRLPNLAPPEYTRAESERAIAAERAYLLGRSAMTAQRYQEAQDHFAAALEHDNREPTYRVALGLAILARGEGGRETARQRASICFRQALELDPSHRDANLALAQVFLEVGDRVNARTLLDRVLRRSPEHPDAVALLRRMS